MSSESDVRAASERFYAALNAMNRPDRKIITAEDPVEYYLPGINQVEVKHNIGLDFARVIRSMLRQAPNIILVGETLDELAFKATHDPLTELPNRSLSSP